MYLLNVRELKTSNTHWTGLPAKSLKVNEEVNSVSKFQNANPSAKDKFDFKVKLPHH